jgi:hypothetical protein
MAGFTRVFGTVATRKIVAVQVPHGSVKVTLTECQARMQQRDDIATMLAILAGSITLATCAAFIPNMRAGS